MDTVKLRGILADLIRARIALGAGRSSEKITIEQAQKLIGLSYDALTDAVAALRETSVVFAAIIGVVALGEPFHAQRAIAALVILAGVILLRIG